MSSLVYKVVTQPTTPIQGQKPGTSGLRKPTKIFMEPNYTENFIQATVSAAVLQQPATCRDIRLVLGGDGRFFTREALERIIIPMCAANQISEVLVGHRGILSTPAASCVIRTYKLDGGILLTASHNPGGSDADFGIKYNCENGGPAPEKVTNAIFEETGRLTSYYTLDQPLDIDLEQLGQRVFKIDNGRTFKVTVISSVNDYLVYMRTIFDFNLIRSLIGKESQSSFKLLVSGMHGVMGPYIREILCNALGMDPQCAIKADALEDFGGGHPDPNLTYAADLVQMVVADSSISMAAAFDGDGDRNMLIGRRGFFISPCDSLAVIADNTNCIKYFREKGVNGFARSMPTSRAIDKVCQMKEHKCYEVPTGWKFFGNLMDAGLCSVCGEESFGTGSDHIREKDGMWALLAWLSILATRYQSGNPFDLETVMREHWIKYGRYFFTRYDYENIESAQGESIMKRLTKILEEEDRIGGTYQGLDGKTFTLAYCDNFAYDDPVDHSRSTNQGIRFIYTDGSRFVFRLSGTGSSGATLRIYVDTYEPDVTMHTMETQIYLRSHITLALHLCRVAEITGRTEPTVIT